MNSTNDDRNFKLALGCATLMLIIASAVQLYSFKLSQSRLAYAPSEVQGEMYVIANMQGTQACVSVQTGQVLWECAGETCTANEINECMNSSTALAGVTESSPLQATEETGADISSQEGQVAGDYDSAPESLCSRPGVGYTGQGGCWSKNKLSVIVGPQMFDLGTSGVPTNVSQFTRGASRDLGDTVRKYDVSKGEVVRFAIKMKNNSSAPVTDNYEFFIGKVTQAPIGVPVTSTTPLCEAQFNKLNADGNTSQSGRLIFSGRTYTMLPGQEKLLTAEWKPTNTDCGVYQLDLGSEAFGQPGKTGCANPSTDRVIAAAFIRVVGCTTTPPVESKPLTCTGIGFYNDQGTALISSVKPGQFVKVDIKLDRSPLEMKAKTPIFVLPVFPSQLEYISFVQPASGKMSCVKQHTDVQCMFNPDSPDKHVVLNFKVSPTATPTSTIAVTSRVTYNGADIGGNNCKGSIIVEKPEVISCTYMYSPWVEQYRSHRQGFDVNSPKALSLITVPNNSEGKRVNIVYEYRPIRDKTSSAGSIATEFKNEGSVVKCGPQSNEDAWVYLSTETTETRVLTADHGFLDNKYLDALDPADASQFPSRKTWNLTLKPGVYALNARWGGDGTTLVDGVFAVNPTYQYLKDVSNPSLGSITYSQAVANPAAYGPLCKWSGSYEVRTGYCFLDPVTQGPTRLENISVTIKNPSLITKFAVEVFANGAKLGTITANRGASKTVVFNSINTYPVQSILEVKLAPGSKQQGTVTQVTIKANEAVLYTNSTPRNVGPYGLRMIYK